MQPQPSTPISAELWARLRRFDPHCSIIMQRRDRDSSTRREVNRVWVVTIADKREKCWEYVQIEAPRLADALLLAVEDAERRGWTRR